jgi:2-dehydropantoate 2-reductase
MDALAPSVGPETIVVPLLNGMRHLDELDARFGPGRIFGGRCLISARLAENGHVEHLSDINEITFGGRSAEQNNRLAAVAEALGGARFDARASNQILLEMWEKWIFIATLAGVSCLMRASIGDVVEAGGSDLAVELLEECRSIAEGEGHAPREAFVEWAKGRLTEPGSSLKASMLGDLERGSRTEADHILGDLLRRGVRQGPSSLLKAAYTALKAQELSFGSPRSPETHARSGYSPRPESA